MSYEKSTPASPEAHSGSPVQANLQALAALFPSVVRDGQVDVDALRQLCGEAVVKEDELFGLNWHGKAEARAAALTPSLGTLRPCKEESKDWDTTQNIYIEGDNLEVLKLLRKSYSGRIKMIYIDPPYNTGKEFVYPDNYQDSIANYKQLTGQNGKFSANTETSGRFHTNWLNMMYPRLVLARELLSDDGVIFISIGEDEIYNLRSVCNDVFGDINFRNAFITRRYDKNLNRQFMKDGMRSFNIGFEYIICYSKPNFLFSPVFRKSPEERQDNGYWKGFWNDANRSTMRYELLGVTPESGQWKWKKEVALEAVANYEEFERDFKDKMSLEEYWLSTGKTKKFIRRNPNGKGMNSGVESWISPTNEILRNTSWMDLLISKKDETTQDLFDFPKNVEVIKLALQAGSKESSIILDFFSGSATTAHAVMQLNAKDGGNRRFIMVQLPEPCDEKSEAAKAGYQNICEIGKERIRRAGEKVKAEAGLEGQNPDIGFRVYKLDSSNVKAWNPQPTDLVDAMESYGEHLVAGRTEDDFLTEILLKSGIDLTEAIETRDIAGHKVHSLGYGQYYACMDANLADDYEEVALGIAAWREEEIKAAGGEQQDACTIFVLDKAFTPDDAAKLNFVDILKQHGICNIKAL